MDNGFILKSKNVFLFLAIIMLISIVSPLNAYAASEKYTVNSYIVLLAAPEHGWTTFDVSNNFRESYTTSGSNVTYNHRSAYVSIVSSRYDWDTPYSLVAIAPCHRNSSGTKIKSFTMQGMSVYVPGEAFDYYAKENSTPVTYAKSNTNTSQFTYSITGGINIHTKTLILNLKVY